jgi:hypothetical protein
MQKHSKTNCFLKVLYFLLCYFYNKIWLLVFLWWMYRCWFHFFQYVPTWIL